MRWGLEAVDVSGGGVFVLLAGLPCDRPDQLRLDGLEERLDHRVVVAVSAPAHRDQDAAFTEQRLVVDRAVLRSAVGMVDQPWGGVASRQSTAQRFDRKIALQAVTRGPADDPPGEQVQHDCEVEPALGRPDVGDVRPPLSVRAIRREVLRYQIGGDGPGMLAVRRALEAPFLPRVQPVLTHQPRSAMPPDLMSLIDEVTVHAWAAIGAVRQREGRPDIRAFLLQNYHQERLPAVDATQPHDLFSVLGSVSAFRRPDSVLNRDDLASWLGNNETRLKDRIASWLPSDLSDDDKVELLGGFVDDCLNAVDEAIASDASDGSDDNDDEDEGGDEEAAKVGEERPQQGSQPNKLLDRLLYRGKLPRYDFPTDVATFHVFDRDARLPRVRTH
ncbi:MAG: hypothetical protein HLUCCA12_18175 [Rhodobacteraceae bacterium HLUCCA12]|nr:MAG: hypothetical protein HLUCCA12_18175 [Rhodobacteraceae bacterium HLUCCA12]